MSRKKLDAYAGVKPSRLGLTGGLFEEEQGRRADNYREALKRLRACRGHGDSRVTVPPAEFHAAMRAYGQAMVELLATAGGGALRDTILTGEAGEGVGVGQAQVEV